jgi:hypothetical protein
LCESVFILNNYHAYLSSRQQDKHRVKQMANTYLQIESITSEAFALELEKRFSRIIDAKFLKLNPQASEDRYITRQDVADMFRVTLPTIHALMNARILKPYKVGHKTRFLLSEVKAAAAKTGREAETNA